MLERNQHLDLAAGGMITNPLVAMIGSQQVHLTWF
jgi:hypothetical protein